MSENTLVVDNANFVSEVLESQQPVLVDFYGPNCMPCRQLSPVMDQLGHDFAGQAKVAKLNVYENTDLGVRYQIQAVPTLIFFQNGVVVARLVGSQPLETLRRKLRELVARPQGIVA